MRWFLGAYTLRFNPRHKRFGQVFSGRYKVLVVDGGGNGYLRKVCDYVHLNPVRARLLRAEQRLLEYLGAALVGIWPRHRTGLPGCGWTVCWGSMGLNRTAWSGVRNLNDEWRRGGRWKATGKSGRGFGEVGAWGRRNSKPAF